MKKFYLFFLLSCFSFGLRAQTDSIDVIHYDINLDINNTVKNHHKGYCYLKIKVTNPINHIIHLSLLNHTVDSIYLNGYAADYTYLSPNINITLPSSVTNGDSVDVVVWYSGSQVVELYGWGGMHYDPNIIYSLNVALMDDPHSYARSWFPALDLYSGKATFNLNISTQNTRKAICGGLLDSIENISDSSWLWHWRIPQRVSPYLINVAIANYVLIQDTVQGLAATYPLQVYCFAADSAVVAAKVPLIKNSFHTLENHFGQFRFNRVGYCVTPLGSMEHIDNISLARNAAIGQGDENNSNMFHELGHSWFGNYMGAYCERDIWMKEGWASFSENLSLEANYGLDRAKNYFRNQMEDVLGSIPKSEGYLTLYGTTGTDVYSNTTYRKGAAVVHTLKNYLGDSVFYPAVRSMLEHFGYGVATSFQMRDYLSQTTGVDLTDFFDFYVMDSGYNHYAITAKSFANNSATISIEQRVVVNQNNGCHSSRVPITFLDSNWHQFKKVIAFSGDSTTQTISLPFTPINCFIDLDEQVADATLDNYKIIDSVGKQTFANTYFFAKVNSVSDSIFLRSTLHWLGEKETASLPEGVSRISHKHYWTIEGQNISSNNIEGDFYFKFLSGSNSFDQELINEYATYDSLVLLWRPNAQTQWSSVPITKPDATSGYIKMQNLREGDYIMAIGDTSLMSLNNVFADNSAQAMNLYPNPAKDFITISLPNSNLQYKQYNVTILNSKGQKVYCYKWQKLSNEKTIKFNLPQGVYVITLSSGDNAVCLHKRFVVVK